MMGYFETQGFLELVKAVVDYLKTATEEAESRTVLMAMEYQEILSKQVKEQEEQEKQEQGQGMMRAPYGYCPICQAKGIQRCRPRSKGMDGTDTCENRHKYPSTTAVLQGPTSLSDKVSPQLKSNILGPNQGKGKCANTGEID